MKIYIIRKRLLISAGSDDQYFLIQLFLIQYTLKRTTGGNVLDFVSTY